MARIAVIGAGMGAMAAAARLAVAGHRVAVYERSATYGGAVGRFERDGFAFDTGPGLLHLPAVYRDLFVKTGKEPLESLRRRWSRSTRRAGTSSPTAPRCRCRTPRARGSSRPWTRPSARARASAGATSWSGRGRPGTGRGGRCWRSRCGPTGRCWRARPLSGAAAAAAAAHPPGRHARGGRRRGSWPTPGSPPCWRATRSRTASTRAPPRRARPCCRTWSRPSAAWYVRGGMRELARARVRAVPGPAGGVRLRRRGRPVVEKDGRAAGVELARRHCRGGGRVVAGRRRGRWWSRRWSRTADEGGARAAPAPLCPRQVHGAAWRCAARRPADAVHRTVVHTPDAVPSELTVFSRPDRRSAPTVTRAAARRRAARPDDGHEAVMLTATVPSARPVDWTGRGAARRLRRPLVAAAERPCRGCASGCCGARCVRRRTPKRRPAPRAAPCRLPRWPGRPARCCGPPTARACRACHLVGGWAHPGGGLPHAGMSGALVAGLIVEGPDFRGSR